MEKKTIANKQNRTVPEKKNGGQKNGQKKKKLENFYFWNEMSKRIWKENVISNELCQELIFIHNSLSVPGYIQQFNVVTMLEFMSMQNAPFLIPLVTARDKILEMVEDHFGLECQLCFEFTALFGYYKGSALDYHYDNTRTYLKNRHYSAALYLNDGGGKDFVGGDFVFKDFCEESKLQRITPKAGGLLIFTSGPENIHKVEEILSGTRYTLNIFFTLNFHACEDRKSLFFMPINYCSEFIIPSDETLLPNSSDEKEENENSKFLEETKLDYRSKDGSEVRYIYEKMKMLNISFVEGFGINSSPLLITLESKKLPFVFENILQAIQFCSFVKWKQSSQKTYLQYHLDWHEYKSQLLDLLISILPQWKNIGRLSSTPKGLKRKSETSL